MKVLFHACCAPCSIHCSDALAANGIQFDLFWYNPNIYPGEEYYFRLDAFWTFTENRKITALIEEDHAAFNPDPKNPKGRCAFCYRLRLEKTALFAVKKGYDAFSTSLLISPYQNHELLRQIGAELADLYGVGFFYRDFRPGFRSGQKQAREAGYYMQKYCGCNYSKKESVSPSAVVKTKQGGK